MASTCSTSEVPIPNASAPKAPWVEVWLSPQTIVMPGLGDPELGADHVDDALAVGAERVDRDPELLAVALQRLDLDPGELVGDQARRLGAVGRHVVVGRGQGLVGAADPAAGQPQPVEGLRRGDLVDQVEVDVDEAVGDLVGLPDLVEHGLAASVSLL